jgi:hypothetical protein
MTEHGRHLPVAYRRLAPRDERRSGRSRSRGCSVPTSRCSLMNACALPAERDRDRARHGRCRCAGPSAARPPSAISPARRCSASCRAATPEAARAFGGGAHRARPEGLCGWRAGRGRAAGGDARHARCHLSGAAIEKPRYLMGVGTPDDILQIGGPRHRHVRLRDADPRRPARPGVHAPRQDQSEERAPRRRHRPLDEESSIVRRRATIPAPICITWSAPTRSSA